MAENQDDWSMRIENRVWFEVIALRRQWTLFDELFGKGEDRIDELNKRIGPFARAIQDLLARDVLIRIVTLVDKNKRSLSLLSALKQLPKDDPRVIALRKEVKDFRKREAKRIIEIRNKLIAHRDLDAAYTGLIKSPEKRTVLQAIEAIEEMHRRLMAIHDQKLIGPHVDLVTPERMVSQFLQVLRAGNDALDERRERATQLPSDP